MNDQIIKELNTFLKGNYMAIHAYEKYISRLQDKNFKETFQNIQQNHKEHAAIVAERIQNLGGIATNSIGMKGNMAKIITNIKGNTQNDNSIIKDALVGEYRGIKKSKELLNGDLDPESLKIVRNILEKDEQHVELLNKLLQ